MMRSLLAITFLSLVIVSPSLCAAAEHTPEHRAAALDLLKTMKSDTVMTETIGTVLDAQEKQNPALAKLRPTMLAFFSKYMGWDSLKDEMANMYCDEFNIDEIKQLNAFYLSPLGQKVVSRLPSLAAKGAEIGQRRVAEHLPELQQMVRDQLSKDNGAAPAPRPNGQ